MALPKTTETRCRDGSVQARQVMIATLAGMVCVTWTLTAGEMVPTYMHAYEYMHSCTMTYMCISW